MSKRTDISQQIRKYLNGELDAPAMHRLEQEALNDPFLSEALEGYEKAGSNQEQHLGDIYARLQERINDKRKRVVLWRSISISASVLIVLTIGGLWLRNAQSVIKPIAHINKINKTNSAAPKVNTPHENNIAQQDKKAISPARVKKPAINKGYIVVNNTVMQADAGSPAPGVSDINEYKSLAATDVQKDSARTNEVVVIGYGTQKRKDLTGSVATIQPPQVINKDSAAAMNRLTGKVAGIQVFNPKLHSVTGTVVAKEDGLPIPGVTVKIKGSNVAAQTDANGKFTLNSVPDKSILDFSFIGYEMAEAETHKKDSLVIAMQPSSNSLNEVVVVNNNREKNDDEAPQYQAARPAEGWKAFKEYLKNNVISPDGKTGVVRLSFIVNTDNSISDFKIIKSVSAKTDSAAIELVKNGSGWIKSTDNKPQKVRLRIKFTGR